MDSKLYILLSIAVFLVEVEPNGATNVGKIFLFNSLFLNKNFCGNQKCFVFVNE